MTVGVNDNIHIQVSLVVQLVDDYTDQVLHGAGISIEVDGNRKPVRKADGFFVFTNLCEDRVLLRVNAPLYQEEIHSVDLNRLDNKYCLIKLRLKPNRSYGLPKGTTCIEGKAEPRGQIFAYLPKSNAFCKLLFDAKKKTENGVPVIKVYNPENMDLEERYLMLVNEEEKKEELIRIVRLIDKENGVYQMEDALKNDYKKIGSRLYLVATSTANQEGNYFLPLKSVNKQDTECILMEGRTINKIKVVKLEEGRINHIDFMKEGI